MGIILGTMTGLDHSAATVLPERSAAEIAALEKMAETLADSGLYRVLRRFKRRARYAEEDGEAKRSAVFVDIETTGLDARKDAIIELACVPFEYGVRTGRTYAVGQPLSYFEDPGRPIPPEITELTGITDETVRGQRIDDAKVAAALDDVALVVAHNAGFDRRFLERRLAAFARKPWACSQQEVPWGRHGCRGTKLEYILFRVCGEYFNGHRAVEDCYAGIHILSTPIAAGVTPLALLLESSRKATLRLWAVNSAFECKELFKERKYRWNPGDDGRPKAWYIEVPEHALDEERRWLKEHAYPNMPVAVKEERLTALTRYSGRGG
ncbi:MAG: 3'-5' exonuclease [Gemmatimonadaceae bacterium]